MSYYNIKNNERTFFYLLSIVDKIFKKHDIEYWLDYGSLLGAIREGTYIEWDNDMDISIHSKDIKNVRKLKDEFNDYHINLSGFIKHGVSFRNASMCIFPITTITKNKKKYLVLFRYPFYHHINKIVNKICPKLNPLLESCGLYEYLCRKIRLIKTVKSPFENLGGYAYVNFCDCLCPVPQYPDKYLSFIFGDWRIPHQFKKHDDINNMYDVRNYK